MTGGFGPWSFACSAICRVHLDNPWDISGILRILICCNLLRNPVSVWPPGHIQRGNDHQSTDSAPQIFRQTLSTHGQWAPWFLGAMIQLLFMLQNLDTFINHVLNHLEPWNLHCKHHHHPTSRFYVTAGDLDMKEVFRLTQSWLLTHFRSTHLESFCCPCMFHFVPTIFPLPPPKWLVLYPSFI